MWRNKKYDALEMLIFLKKKRDGTIKARGCTEGQKQRKKYNNVDVMPPVLSTEAVIIYAVIDAYEDRDVALVDILPECRHGQ